MTKLSVRGARQHNLQGVDLDLPRNQLTVLTGPSGSGKSSLAFDTIYAEGQRRYVESLSAYARQFLDQLPKPDVESIEGLSPAIAIEQKALGRNPRSTVGTVTEVADYLRLLFARIGTPHCPRSGKVLQAFTVQEIVDFILSRPDGTRLVLLAPVERKSTEGIEDKLERLRRDGFVRARVNGETIDLGESYCDSPALPYSLDVVVDRLVVRQSAKARITDSVELSLQTGQGTVIIDEVGSESPARIMSQHLISWDYDLVLPPLEPRLFSFNGPQGACPACRGLGSVSQMNVERVVPDPELTLREGAVAAFGPRGSIRMASELHSLVKALRIDPDTPWNQLLPSERAQILEGAAPVLKGRSKRSEYVGIERRLEALSSQSTGSLPDDPNHDNEALELEAHQYLITATCPDCRGSRLRAEALSVRIGGRNIGELSSLPLLELSDVLTTLSNGEHLCSARAQVAAPLVDAIVQRLGFLVQVGLGYLTLSRATRSLSGGEGQRIRLATQIGAALVGVLYVLDEPSIGLHASDNQRLLRALRQLVDKGNTVLVVEHDREAIMAADYLVDMGPGAGRLGGKIVAQGTPEEVINTTTSVTGPYLQQGDRTHRPRQLTRPSPTQAIRLSGATLHNLKNIDVEFPLGLLSVVTGVSGAGKSALVVQTLLPAIRAQLYGYGGPIGPHSGVEGIELIDKVISIDQSAIGRSPRSNPATYTGIFTQLRDLFSGLPDSRARGYKPGRFSFNVKGGRCETCKGDGVLRVEMHFLPDVFVQCSSCLGRRYNRETLEIKYRGLSISNVLGLTVDEATPIFENVPRVQVKLSALQRIGLGYLQLGQSGTTLSGGEAQRIKLATELAKRSTGSTLYVLDEPTTGLHFADVELLLSALWALRDAGNTIVVIEHNLELANQADWLIDIGPGPGNKGGHLIAAGPPEVVAACGESVTAQFLTKSASLKT